MKKVLFPILALVLAVGLAVPMAMPTAAGDGEVTVYYGDIELPSGGGFFLQPDIWNLNAGDVTVSYTLDLSGAPNVAYTGDYGQSGYVGLIWPGSTRAGAWMSGFLCDWGNADTEFPSYPDNDGSQDMDDKFNMQRSPNPGSWSETMYDVYCDTNTVAASPFGSWDNYGIWFDRDGVDEWQANMWGMVNGGTYNTDGVYEVQITYRKASSTKGTACPLFFPNLESDDAPGGYGVPTGFDQSSPGPGYDYFPAGISFDTNEGKMAMMQVFVSGNPGDGTIVVKNLTVTGCRAPVTLWAGQDIDVGTVTVTNDGDNLYVTYETTGDWVITETHLAVGTELSDIPQTKTGNPIPGKFTWSEEHDPPVSDYLYTIPLDGWDAGTPLYIAAHAKVVQKIEECMNVVSDAGVEWSADGTSWNPAVACWVHPSWNDIAGATWIWRTEYTDVVGEYDNVPEGGWYFQRAFTIPGDPISGEITINVDNAYELYLNDMYVGGEGAMSKDGPDGREWSTLQTFDLTNLNSGENTIEVRALNFFRTGSSTSNPAGLAFSAEVCYEDIIAEETAWGDGVDFPGKNWATYFEYTVSE